MLNFSGNALRRAAQTVSTVASVATASVDNLRRSTFADDARPSMDASECSADYIASCAKEKVNLNVKV